MEQRWIQDPFVFNLDSMDDCDIMKDDLVELQANGRIRMELESMQLDMFWYAQIKTFQQLAFDSYASIHRPEPVWMQVTCVALSKKEPRFNIISEVKQL